MLMALTNGEHLASPDAPVTTFYIAAACLALAGLIISPPIFFRLPKSGKLLAYFAAIGAFFFLGAMLGQVQEAYYKTPAGQVAKAELEAEAARQVELDAEVANRQRQADEREADAQRQREVDAEMADTEAKLRRCLAMFGGGVPELKDRVKESLHNPDSFEHVETSFLGVTGTNTFMTFRAENGFGATRTGRVSARVDPDSCEVKSMGDLSSL